MAVTVSIKLPVVIVVHVIIIHFVVTIQKKGSHLVVSNHWRVTHAPICLCRFMHLMCKSGVKIRAFLL